jgi:acyl phosphate:glycerol-3-phosphate acyltransferase
VSGMIIAGWFFSLLFGYLMGSVSSAIIVCRLMGLADPREHGSQNPGATNVLRVTGSKKAAAITLMGDFLKGLIPVGLMVYWFSDSLIAHWVLFFAFLGHLFPIFFRFEGGKGVATALGGLFGLSPFLGGVMVLSWVLSAVLFRISSLAAISAFAGLPLYAMYFYQRWEAVVPLLLVTICLLWRHRGNIIRLNEGVEPKIGAKASH